MRPEHAATAGWSGLVFAALLVVGLLLVSRTPGPGDPDGEYTTEADAQAWLTGPRSDDRLVEDIWGG